MKLWILKPIDSTSGPWGRNPYGAAFCIIVRAKSKAEARRIATTECTCFDGNRAAEGYDNPKLTTCVELTADGPAEFIIGDGGTG
jgi:hypothetical protein